MFVRIKGNKKIFKLIGTAYNGQPVPIHRRGKAILQEMDTLNWLYVRPKKLEVCTDRPETIAPKEFN